MISRRDFLVRLGGATAALVALPAGKWLAPELGALPSEWAYDPPLGVLLNPELSAALRSACGINLATHGRGRLREYGIASWLPWEARFSGDSSLPDRAAGRLMVRMADLQRRHGIRFRELELRALWGEAIFRRTRPTVAVYGWGWSR